MEKIIWDNVYKMSRDEFSEDPEKYADPELMYSLGRLRKEIDGPMYPSPVSGALARFEGSKTSQHYVGNQESPERLSTASDVFIEGIPFQNYTSILVNGGFGGFGIYLETKGPDGLPWIMFHLDIRPKDSNSPLIWIVERVYDPARRKKVDKYRYPQSEPKYWELLNDERFFRVKQFGV